MKNIVVMTIGLPGSGKSTFLNELGPRYLFSPDSRLLTDDGYHWTPSRGVQSWREEYQSYGETLRRIAEGEDEDGSIGWDSNFTSRASRSALINFSKGFGYPVIGVFLDTPVKVAQERNEKVPEATFTRMVEKLEKPGSDEGFESVYTVTEANWDETISRLRYQMKG